MSVPPGPNPPFFQGGQPAPQHGYQQPGAPYPAGGQYPSGGPYPPYANPGGVNTQPQPRPGGKKLLIAGVIVLAVGLVGGVIMAIMGIGGAVGTDNVGDTTRNFANIGLAYGFGPLNTSIGYGKIFHANNDFTESTGIDKGSNLVVSADYALAPGLVLAGDVAWFDNDTSGAAAPDTGDQGWAAVGRLAVAF